MGEGGSSDGNSQNNIHLCDLSRAVVSCEPIVGTHVHNSG